MDGCELVADEERGPEMKRLFKFAVEKGEYTGEQMVTISWETDRVMTFGDEMAFESVDDFLQMVVDSVKFADKTGMLGRIERAELKMTLDKK